MPGKQATDDASNRTTILCNGVEDIVVTVTTNHVIYFLIMYSVDYRMEISIGELY